MENNQKRSYAHPYGSTVIPHGHLGQPRVNGAAERVPGTPSVIPGTIGAAGLPKITTIADASHDPSSIARLVDGFIEQLVERAAELVVEKVLERFELVKQAVAHSNPDADPNPSSHAVLSPDYARAMTAEQPSRKRLTIDDVSPEAALAHQRLQDALQDLPAFKAGSRIALWRSAPAPIVFTTIGESDTAPVEWSVYSAAYDNPRFPVKASPGKYMVLVNGVRLDVHRARIEEISAELSATFAEEDALVNKLQADRKQILVTENQDGQHHDDALRAVESAYYQAFEAIRPRQIALGDEKRALEAAQGLTIEEIIEKVAKSMA